MGDRRHDDAIEVLEDRRELLGLCRWVGGEGRHDVARPGACGHRQAPDRRQGRADPVEDRLEIPPPPLPELGYFGPRERAASVQGAKAINRFSSSVIRISQSWVVRPTWTGTPVPVSQPSPAGRMWFTLISSPSTMRSGAFSQPPTEARVSARTAEAPPCR